MIFLLIIIALLALAVTGLLLFDVVGQKICRLYEWFLTRKF